LRRILNQIFWRLPEQSGSVRTLDSLALYDLPLSTHAEPTWNRKYGARARNRARPPP